MSSSVPNHDKWKSVVWLGDVTLPWFDACWPSNGPRKQFNGSIDLEVAEPVAGFAGTTTGVVFPHSTAENWEQVLVQKLLVKHEGEWVVLCNQAKTRDVYEKIPGLEDYLDFDREVIGPRSIQSLGLEGTIVKKKITWRDAALEKRQLAFHGDDTLRRVVNLLVDWGFVTSDQWPKLLEKHPSFKGLIPYLIAKEILYSDGTHPSHPAAADNAKAG